jgi:malate permease and related proteins
VIAEIASIVAPVYLVVALGFVWIRLGRPYDVALISDLITNVGAPCLVFSSLTSLEVERAAVLHMVGATLLALAIFAAVGAVVLRAARLSLQTWLPPVVFMNAGNMGLPLCLFAFGREGLGFAVCFYATCAMAHFSAGLWIWSARVSSDVLLRSPLAWATAASALVLALDAPVPGWLHDTTALLGGFTIPLLQFTLGVSLARLPFAGVGRAFGISCLRLGMGFAVGVGLAMVLGLSGAQRGVFILDCAMPVAVFNYVLAERYGRAPAEVASAVVISTLLAFATIPALLSWLL